MTTDLRRLRACPQAVRSPSAWAAAVLMSTCLSAMALPADPARVAEPAVNAQARACLQGTSHHERAWCMRQAAVVPATTPRPARWAPASPSPATAHVEPS